MTPEELAAKIAKSASKSIDFVRECPPEMVAVLLPYAEALLEMESALRNMLPSWSTGNPSDAESVEFWQREHGLGRGEARFVLAAYAALSSADRLLGGEK